MYDALAGKAITSREREEGSTKYNDIQHQDYAHKHDTRFARTFGKRKKVANQSTNWLYHP